MDTNKAAPPAGATTASAPAPAKASSTRLVVLVGLLVVALGALAYDYYVAKPACDAADQKIEKFVEERNKKGVREAELVNSADIQKEIGKAPTWVVKNDKDGYTVEYYCWWGKMPLLSRRRHFIAVVYVGREPRHYSAHYREEPPAEAFPIPETASAGEGGQAGDTKGDQPAADAPTEKAADAKAAEGKDEQPAEGKTEAKDDKPANAKAPEEKTDAAPETDAAPKADEAKKADEPKSEGKAPANP